MTSFIEKQEKKNDQMVPFPSYSLSSFLTMELTFEPKQTIIPTWYEFLLAQILLKI